jgi:hypothetical protein
MLCLLLINLMQEIEIDHLRVDLTSGITVTAKSKRNNSILVS